jgi:hypothetical protein
VALINYKSSQIHLNQPNKVLGISVSAIAGKSYWDHANGSGDLWYSGSGSKKYYQWTVTFSVTAQGHGSHLSRDDFTYNGLDVVVGDWVAGATTGQCLKIISIDSKTTNSVTCVVEDWLRYNTFKSATGDGVFSTGAGIIFSLNELGLPMLDPLPTTAASSFYATVMSRFQYLNPSLNYVLEKTAHGFSRGDVICADSSGYVKATSSTMAKMIGVVVESGPGPNMFMISPNTRIIDFDPSIPGVRGDYIYVDTDGDLTTTDTGKIAFLKIQNSIPTNLLGTINTPSVPDTHVLKLNGTSITFAGTGSANATLAQMVTQINAGSSTHKVVAVAAPTATVINSNPDSTAYGLIGGYTTFAASFDNGSAATATTVTFSTNTAGQAKYGSAVAIPSDMATDINAASITNLTASSNDADTQLTLTEANGNAVTIANITSDSNGNPFVGGSNVSGLVASTSATGTSRINLARSDGGEILIYEGTEHFRVNTGIASGHTGMLPLALNVEQGIRSGTTSVVANISARDSLTVLTGDQAHVLSAADGEWALYLYNGSVWVKISDADSSTTDAKTLTTTFTMPASGFGVSTTNTLGNISAGGKITSVSIDVATAFSGHSGGGPNIEIGTTADPDQFVNDPSNDLTDVTVFMPTSEHVHPAGSAQDLEVKARCNHYNATAGTVTVKLTYI